MLISESHIVETDEGERYSMGYDVTQDLKDTYMGEDATLGDIYRAAQKEHGRCTGKVYVDTKSRGTIAVGWVFVKREKYEDDPKQSFLHETWITLLDKDETIREIEYHNLGR